MATMTVTRPAYKLIRSTSFDHAVPTMKPFTLGPAPFKAIDSIEQAITNLRPVVGQTLSEWFEAAIRTAAKRLAKFQKDCTFNFYCWLFNPNAIILLIFWPGWLFLGLLYMWWTW